MTPGQLREYFDAYSSPFPQNQRYFLKLASTINWADVDNGIRIIPQIEVSRFRTFGTFLRFHELPEELTWQVIAETRARLNRKDQWNSQCIRSCLFELGHLLAESGLMQDWNSYRLERCLLKSLNSVSDIFRDHVSAFQSWVLSGMPNPGLELPVESFDLLSNCPASLLDTVRSVNAMLNWSLNHRIESLTEINATVISNYQDTLFWKHECGNCGKCVPFDSYETLKQCINCEATGTYVPVRRLSRSSTVAITSRIRVFFDWAYLHGLVTNNPVRSTKGPPGSRTFTIIDGRGKTIEVGNAIRRYDDSVLDKFGEYIVSADAEPEEAIILYLVIFHLLTVSDLCDLRIPSLVRNRSKGRPSGDAENYQYLVLPSRKATRGKRSSSRPEKIKFLDKALPRLVSLLERYYEKRNYLVRAQQCEYLIATSRSSRHNKPVSETYVKKVLGRTSIRLLGGTVCISDLRQTAAVVISQRSKRRSAVLTKMGYGSKWATRFNYLETFILKPKTSMPSLPKNGMVGVKKEELIASAVAPV